MGIGIAVGISATIMLNLQIGIEARDPKDRALFAVVDIGHIIDPEVISRIVQLNQFVRGNHTNSQSVFFTVDVVKGHNVRTPQNLIRIDAIARPNRTGCIDIRVNTTNRLWQYIVNVRLPRREPTFVTNQIVG